MSQITLTIGQDCEIYSHSTKQKGYGRQGLYVELKRTDIPFDLGKSFIKNVYLTDVFPNVKEHFNGYILEEDAFPNEDGTLFHNCNGNGEYTPDHMFKTTDDMLNHAFSETEVEIEVEDDEEE